jgi:hypothetical protein
MLVAMVGLPGQIRQAVTSFKWRGVELSNPFSEAHAGQFLSLSILWPELSRRVYLYYLTAQAL